MATPPGRPTKLTPEVHERICNLLRAGNTLKIACESAGVGVSTVLEWIARGEDRHSCREGDEVYAAFAEAIRKAESDAAVRNVALIQKAAAEGNWQASAWWLERKFPADWAKVDRHEHTGRGGGPIQVQAAIDPEKIKARIVELARELGYTQPPGIGPGEVIDVEAAEVKPD